MLRTSLLPAALAVCLLAASLKIPAQSNISGNANATTSAAPLLPSDGLTDDNGWSWPGMEWKHVSPESEGFSAKRLEALRSFLKTHQTDGMMVICRGHVVFEYGNTKLVS